MSNIRAITGSTKIMNRPTHGGSKKQGIPSTTNLNTTAHVAFRNRNVVCACNRHVVFCMNQLGGVGAGGVPGNSYMFAPRADGINKNKILCGVNHKNILNPSQFELIYKTSIDLLAINKFFTRNKNLAIFELVNDVYISGISFINLYSDNNNFKKNFYLINEIGKKSSEDLIGKEYIILAYSSYKNGTNNKTLLTFQFRLKSFNINNRLYHIDWIVKPANYNIIFNESYGSFVIKEIYVKK